MKKDVFKNLKWGLLASMALLALTVPVQGQNHGHAPVSHAPGLHKPPHNTTICSGSSATLKAKAGPKHSVKWYTSAVGGTPIATGKVFITPILTTTTTYYYETSVGGIITSPRTDVTVTVIPASGKVWDKTYGSTRYEGVWTIAPANGGGYIFGGTSFIINTDEDGNVIWQNPLPPSTHIVYSIVPFPDGSGYLAGGLTETDSTTLDWKIFKLNNAGNVVWTKSFGGTRQDDLLEIIPAKNGGFILAGISESSDGDVSIPNKGFIDYWIIKIDNAGNKIWDKSFGGSGHDILSSIIRTHDGYLLGGRSNSSDGDVTDGNNGSFDFWIVKTDFNGNKIWDKSYGGSSEDQLFALSSTPGHGYLLAGLTLSTDGDITDGNNGQTDALIIKIDALGNKVWDKTYGSSSSDNFTEIIPTKDGFILGGYTWGSDGDVTDGNNGLGDFWIVKTDLQGNKKFDKTYGSSEADTPWASLRLNDNSILIGGESNGSDGDITDGNSGSKDFLVFKLDLRCFDNDDKRESISFENEEEVLEAKVFPNPFSDFLNIKFPASDNGPVTIEISDLSGKTVAVFNESNSDSNVESIINTSSFEKGFYICKLIVNDKVVEMIKVIKQ